MDAVAERVQSVFRNVLNQSDLVLERETTALDVDGWDSLAHIQILVALEKEFKIRIGTSDVIGLRNVGEMIDLVSSKLTSA